MQVIEEKKLSEKIYYKKLHNNMEVFLMKKEGISKKYANFQTKFGSNDLIYINPHTNEKVKVNEGIAHFLEHKMFEMPDGSDAFAEFSNYGANANAMTSFDTTSYIFSCTDDESFEKCIKHLINYVQTPHFTDENVEKEKGIIAQEIRMYDDNPGWQLFFNLLRAMYKTHPNSIDIAGDVDSIYKITKEELYNCYSTFYSPSNMQLFAVGDIDIEKTFEIIENTVKDKNMFDGQVQIFGKEETDSLREKRHEEEMEVSIPSIMIGFKERENLLKNIKSILEREIAVEIINDIIFGKSSDLYNELFTSGLIYTPFSKEYVISKTYGYNMISVSTNNIEEVEEKMMKEIDKFKKNKISSEDFTRIKNKKIGQYIKKYDDIEEIADDFLSYNALGENLFEYYDILNNMTVDFVNGIMIQVFDEEMYSVSIIRPKK